MRGKQRSRTSSTMGSLPARRLRFVAVLLAGIRGGPRPAFFFVIGRHIREAKSRLLTSFGMRGRAADHAGIAVIFFDYQDDVAELRKRWEEGSRRPRARSQSIPSQPRLRE